MNWFIKHLPEIVGVFIFAMGMFTIISNYVATNSPPNYMDAFVYVGATVFAFSILKAVQIICGELFKKRNK